MKNSLKTFRFRCIALLLIWAMLSSLLCLSAFVYGESADGVVENSGEEKEITEEKPVLYVNGTAGSDDNTGESTAQAVATFGKAYELLKDGDGTVVVCGATSVKDGILPPHNGNVVLTSYYDGADFRSKKIGAALVTESALVISGPGNTTVCEIKLQFNGESDIYCCGSNVTFASGVDNTCRLGGYPTVFGGILLDGNTPEGSGCFSDYTICVESGYWRAVCGGNRRTDLLSPLPTLTNVSVSIKGGTFIATDIAEFTCSAVTGARADGTVRLSIDGGVFYGSVYLLGSVGPILPSNSQKSGADLFLTIRDAAFLGKYIKAVKTGVPSTAGSYRLEVTGGSFSSIRYAGCDGVEGGVSADVCDSLRNKIYGFRKTVFLSENGDDGNTGRTPDAPKKTLSSALTELTNGGVVVLCSSMTLPDGYVARKTSESVTLTSRYEETDYAATANAGWHFEGNCTFPSDVVFENTVFSATEQATLVLCGNDNRIGDGVKVSGNVNLLCERTSSLNRLTIGSGTFGSVTLGASDVRTVFTLSGGSVTRLCGVSEYTEGDILADLCGGTLGDGSVLSGNGAGGSIELLLGNVTLSGTLSAVGNGNAPLCEVLLSDAAAKEHLSGFSIIEDRYVFVRDGGTGDGRTVASAAPDLKTGYALLGQSDGIVVICGPLTVKSENGTQSTGTLTYTTGYRGMDLYESDGAEWLLAEDFRFPGDATMKNIRIRSLADDLSFRCMSHIVLFGEGIEIQPYGVSRTGYPSVIGADKTPEKPYNNKGESLSDRILLYSGTWNEIHGSASSVVWGGTYLGPYYVTEDLPCNATLTVNGGVFCGGIYGAKTVEAGNKSRVVMSFNAGELHGILSPSEDPSTDYRGTFTLNFTNADLSGLSEIRDASFIGGNRSYSYVIDTYDQTQSTGDFSLYQTPLTVTDATICRYHGQWVLFRAEGNAILSASDKDLTYLCAKPLTRLSELPSECLSLSVSVTDTDILLYASCNENGAEKTVVLRYQGTTLATLGTLPQKGIRTPQYVTDNGTNILYYSDGTSLYVVRMSDPVTPTEEPILLLSPENKWEAGTLTCPVFFRNRSGSCFLLYATGPMGSGNGMLGLCRIADGKLTDPSAYVREADPVFYPNDIACDFSSPSVIAQDDDGELLLLYTAHMDNAYRLMLQTFTDDANGIPYFGSPCDTTMRYPARTRPTTLATLLSGWKINVKEEVDTDSIVPQPFSPDALSPSLYAIAIAALVVMILIPLAIIFIRHRRPSASAKGKHTSKDSRHPTVGQQYAQDALRRKSETAVTDAVTDLSLIEEEDTPELSDESILRDILRPTSPETEAAEEEPDIPADTPKEPTPVSIGSETDPADASPATGKKRPRPSRHI